jgi:flagellar protein FlaG
MNANLSVGGTYSNSVERPHPVEPVAEVKTKAVDKAPYPSNPLINSTVEMKRAELKGETYSISDEQLVRAIERAIKAMQGKSTSLEFSIHEKTNLISVKVLDRESGEIIREIPPEKNLDFVAKLWEMAGILVDERR